MAKRPQGELEGLVMDVLWDSTEPLTPAAVRDRLAGTQPLAYTTVMTVLVRLTGKGLAVREPAGRAFAYRPRVSREERAAQRMGELLAATRDRSVVLSRFVASLPPEEAAELRRALDDES
jgi:predicted transcriptional regulator